MPPIMGGMAMASHTAPLASRPDHRRTRVIVAIVVVAAAVAATVGIILRNEPSPPQVVRETPTVAPAPAPTSLPSPTSPSPSIAAPATVPTAAPWRFAYQPLWPFPSAAAAEAWRLSATTGTQPWHASADQTALMFTQGFLGFTELDLVTSHTGTATDAHVGVGGPTEGTATSTAAVIHLVRFGPAADAPWEVVGTDDTTLSLTTPRYGASVGQTVAVGGQITGVDESIHVQFRQPTEPSLLGDRCCVPGGGDRQPWSTTVTVQGASDPVATIVAWTGGHVRSVERFAVTAVRPR